MKKKPQKKCIISGCNKVAIARGLCRDCYNGSKRMVHSGRTTWEELAENKLALSVTKTPFTKAFTKMKKTKLITKKSSKKRTK